MAKESADSVTGVQKFQTFLTADELHLIQDRVAALRLPSRFHQSWNTHLTTAEIDNRNATALTGLVSKGVVSSAVPFESAASDLSG